MVSFIYYFLIPLVVFSSSFLRGHRPPRPPHFQILNVNETDQLNETPQPIETPPSETLELANAQLILLIRNHQIPQASEVIEKNAHSKTVLDETGPDGNSPLTLALSLTSPEMDPIARALLDHGADARAHSPAWTRALRRLVKQGNIDLLKKLKAHGLDLKSIHVANAFLFSYAAKYNQMEILQFLKESFQGADENQEQNRDEDLVRAINQPDAHGRCAIHFAAHFGHVEIIQFLDESGANLNEPLEGKWFPFHLAADAGHMNVLTYLVNRGIDLKQTTKGGLTVLHLAARHGHLDVMKYAIEQQLDVNQKDFHGNSAIHWAARAGKLDVVKLLAAQGAQLNQENRFGVTPYLEAENQNHKEVAQFLLKETVDPYYMPIIEGAEATSQLKSCKSNLMADLKEEQKR